MNKLLAAIILALPAIGYADSLSFCSSAPATSTSIAGTYGYNTLLSSTSPLVSGACKAPPPPSQCIYGLPSDVSGYVGLCGGWWYIHTPINVLRGPDVFTYKNIFGNKVNDWPGGPFGTTEFWGAGQSKVASNQYIAIPFVPNSDHTIVMSVNDTFTGHPMVIDIATKQGIFNNAAVGNGVVCISGLRGLASFTVTTRTDTVAQCKLTKGTQYWFNMIPAIYASGEWKPQPTTMGITVQGVN